jgi:alpha-L-arabinofuranosidase
MNVRRHCAGCGFTICSVRLQEDFTPAEADTTSPARLANPAVRRHLGGLSAVLVSVAALAASQPTPQPLTARIEIDAAKVEGRISPLLYGQFLEFMFEGIKRGLDAEMIRNRGFEEPPNAIGLSRYWERYPDDRNDDYGMSFTWDDAEAYRGAARPEAPADARSVRVQLRPGVIQRHGLYQSRLPVKGGLEYRGSIWMKSDSFAGAVTLSLEADVTGGHISDQAEITDVGGEWTRYPFTLRPATSDPLARFAILFTGRGTVWVDQVSLVPGDAVGGVRADVFEKVKALAPAFIRWPGGNVAQDYRWPWGVGPRDERPAWINLSWKNEREPSDFGTDEFIRFARAVGAEPSITVNVEGRGANVDEAASWVEYCNAAPTTSSGALRARNGHPEPYAVTYWELGNEIWGDWVRGHSDAPTYARNFTRYAAAMRAVDPSIRLIAVGDNDMAWNRTVMQLAGERLDYLAVHHYYGRRGMDSDLRNLMARPLHYERWYAEFEAALRQFPADRRPRLAVNEWGLDLPESQQYSIVSALYAARLMNVFERKGDLIAMSAVSDLVNGWPGGIIQAGDHGVFVTPIYLVNQLYAARLGSQRLSAALEVPTFSTSREGADIPSLDIVVSRSADDRTIFVKAVNTDLERPLKARIQVRGAVIAPQAVVQRVVSTSLTATNGFATPDAVKMTSESLAAGNSFELEMPQHSVAVVTLTIGQ